MPPVFGPASPSPTHAAGVWAGVAVADPLVVLSGGERHGGTTVADGEQRELGPGEALLDHHGPPGIAEGIAREVGAHGIGCLAAVLGDEHSLAGGQSVGLDHEEVGHHIEEGEGGCLVGEGPVPCRGDARLDEHLLHPGLGALQAGAVRSRPENAPTRRAQAVGEAVDQWRLGADHEEVGVDLLGRRGDRSGDARVARGDDDLGITAEDVGEGVR